MIESFEELENAITALEDYIVQLKQENVDLKKKEAVFTSTIEDRDREIRQLQQALKNNYVTNDASVSAEFDKKIEGLIKRVHSMTAKKMTNSGI